MEKYILGEISSSGGATLYKNPSDQTVTSHFFPYIAPLGEKYVIYGRDQATETKLDIFNIWGDGSYRWHNKAIFPIRMSNLNGRKIKATSFDYKPFCYLVDGVYQGYEVISSLSIPTLDIFFFDSMIFLQLGGILCRITSSLRIRKNFFNFS